MSTGHTKNITTIIPALLMMTGAGALIAVTSLLAKSLGLENVDTAGLHALQISAGRFCFAFTALTIFIIIVPSARTGIYNKRWHWHIFRSICGWLGITCMFAAVNKMPVADATAISFLSPLVTIAFAVIVLGESITARTLIAVLLALMGTFLILKPGTESFQYSGLLALAAALFTGIEAVVIKYLSDNEPITRILILNNAIGASISFAAACFVWKWPSLLQWGQMAALGLVMLCAQTLFIHSMKRSNASRVIPAFYTVLVFTAGLDYLVYSVQPTTAAIAGSLLIMSSALFLALQRSR